MPEITRILEQLTQQNARLNTQSTQLEKIETILIENAVQSTKIADMQTQMTMMWVRYDALIGPEGTIARIQNIQSSCPRSQLARIWWAIGSLFSAGLVAVSMIMNHLDKAAK